MPVEQDLRTQIALLEVEPSHALTGIRAALRSRDEETDRALFESLRSATWKLLTSQIYGGEVRQWYDLILQVCAYYVERNVALEAKLTALSELLMESIRFGEVHPADEVTSRQHVLDILRAIDSLDRDKTGARRTDVLETTGLKQSNLSRILATMQSLGLVIKKMRGREAVLFLTARGKSSLNGDGNSFEPGLQLEPNATWFKTGTGN